MAPENSKERVGLAYLVIRAVKKSLPDQASQDALADCPDIDALSNLCDRTIHEIQYDLSKREVLDPSNLSAMIDLSIRAVKDLLGVLTVQKVIVTEAKRHKKEGK